MEVNITKKIQIEKIKYKRIEKLTYFIIVKIFEKIDYYNFFNL